MSRRWLAGLLGAALVHGAAVLATRSCCRALLDEVIHRGVLSPLPAAVGVNVAFAVVFSGAALLLASALLRWDATRPGAARTLGAAVGTLAGGSALACLGLANVAFVVARLDGRDLVASVAEALRLEQPALTLGESMALALPLVLAVLVLGAARKGPARGAAATVAAAAILVGAASSARAWLVHRYAFWPSFGLGGEHVLLELAIGAALLVPGVTAYFLLVGLTWVETPARREEAAHDTLSVPAPASAR